MKLIDYDKYTTKWSMRSTILGAVIEAAVTGFFVAWSLSEVVRGQGFRAWVWPLVLGFSSGVGALQATLIALHKCQRCTKAERDESAPL